MKYQDAVRVADKIKPWIGQRHPEWIVALDALQTAGRTLAGEPPKPEPTPGRLEEVFGKITGEMRDAWNDFAEAFIDLDSVPAPEPEPKPENTEDVRAAERDAFELGFKVARLHYGRQESDFPEGGREFHGAECVRTHNPGYVCTCDDATAEEEARDAALTEFPEPKPEPAPPAIGDTVPNRDAAKLLPIGTVIRDRSGITGMVSKTEGTAGTSTVVRWTEAHPSPVWPATIEWVA